ncbi:hypothetical protein C4553_00390 [Candidatus Parcubacteria bacterium]|nr:MAG: hypothetical protein C4553_00390 [Candidatus Parcubacteria bacterium]
MAIQLFITNQKSGWTRLWSLQNHKGKVKKTFSYRMFILNESGSVREFEVSRDALVPTFIKRKQSKYGIDGEAPPNKIQKPYNARIRTDGKKGFRLELYESGVGKKNNKNVILGTGKVLRKHIQIHIGPGCSEGCFLLTGWTKGREKFKRAIKQMIVQDKSRGIKKAEEFIVRVEKR